MRAPSSSDDEEVARQIYSYLHSGGRAPTEKTVRWIRSEIERLRASVRGAMERPRPSEAMQQVERAARLARDLASCLDDLGPERRWYIRLMVFQERGEGLSGLSDQRGTVPVYGVGSTAEAIARMDAWVTDLKRVREECELMQQLPGDFFSGPKKMCGWVAREIILKLAPATPLTKGGSFYSVTRLLWPAVSNGDESSVKRACDELVDLFRRAVRK